MGENIRIQPRDKELIQRIVDFNGLPGKELVDRFFNGSQYGYRRLKLLLDNDYLKSVFYYVPRKKGEKIITQRISAIYYATPKALREIDCTIDPRFVVPDADKLDVSNLVGRLFARIPNLISKRQAIEKYHLKNFMPITCVVEDDNPMFIYILGNTIGRLEIGRIKGFIESGLFPHATHYIVSRTFHKRLFLPNVYFIPWLLAPEVLPNLAQDRNYYLNKIIKIAQETFPGIRLLSSPTPLIRAQYRDTILHIGELMSGLNSVRLILKDPPENTFIYAPSRRQFYGVNLTQGSFLFYSEKDKRIYEMCLKGNTMYSIPYQIRR